MGESGRIFMIHYKGIPIWQINIVQIVHTKHIENQYAKSKGSLQYCSTNDRNLARNLSRLENWHLKNAVV